MVRVIGTHAEFSNLLAQNADKLVVVDFYADWCGPCRQIAPQYEALANNAKYAGRAVFVKVNVDVNQETSSHYQVTAMPTFQFFHKGAKIDEVKGANPSGVVQLVEKYVQSIPQPAQRRPGGVIQAPLSCTLEELFSGCTKKRKITRERLNDDAKSTRADVKILQIDVKPGWKAGTKITFEGEGDESAESLPGDIQFVLGEKPHDRFRRQGDDLHVSMSLSLAQSIDGHKSTVDSLMGSTKLDVVVPPLRKFSPSTLAIRIPNEGMPISKRPTERGDLVVDVEVDFTTLSEADFAALKSIQASS